MNNPQPGTDYDWNRPIKLTRPGVNGSTVPLPYGLDPARVPVAGSYVDCAAAAEPADLGVVRAARRR